MTLAQAGPSIPSAAGVMLEDRRIQNILVLGGTGFVGRSVCERLVERNGGGGSIVVPTRRLAHGVGLQSLPTLEIVEADVHDDARLAQLMTGMQAVVNLVAVLHGGAARFQHVHVDLPRRLARACAVAGVRRLVHVSALGVGPAAPSNYLRSKTAGETALLQAGLDRTLDLTLLRPSVIFGRADRFMNTFARLQALAPVVPLACGTARFQPVWVDDVASAIERCLNRPATIGKIYQLAGPQVCTLSELVRLAGRWSGRERPQIALPGPLGRLQATLLEWLPGEPLMSRDNLDSMRLPNVASGRLPGLADLDITPTALEAVAPAYLGSDFGRARLERWRAARRP